VTPFLIDDLKRDEGCRLKAYQDTEGYWTIGYGHAHVEPGTKWTQEKALVQLAKDVERATDLLDRNAAWWRTLNDARQDVMVNMCFNMGWGNGSTGLSSFHHTLGHIQAGDWGAAALGLLSSQWAGQVKDRANRLAEQMRTGVRA